MRLHRLRQRFDEQELALLLDETSDRDEAERALGQRRRLGKGPRLDAAMHHVDPVPAGGIGPAAELAAAERADGNGEGGVPHLLAEAERHGMVELLGTVDGEAVGNAAHHVRQHGNGRRVGSEVRVEVRDAKRTTALGHVAGLDQVDQMPQDPGLRGSTGTDGGCQRLHDRPWRPCKLSRQRREKLPPPLPQHVLGEVVLGLVGGVDEPALRAAHGEPDNLVPLPLERQDLTADEAVRRGGISVDQVGEPHAWTLSCLG